MMELSGRYMTVSVVLLPFWSLVRFNCAPNSFDHLSRPEGCGSNLEGLEPYHEPVHEPVVDVSFVN